MEDKTIILNIIAKLLESEYKLKRIEYDTDDYDFILYFDVSYNQESEIDFILKAHCHLPSYFNEEISTPKLIMQITNKLIVDIDKNILSLYKNVSRETKKR